MTFYKHIAQFFQRSPLSCAAAYCAVIFLVVAMNWQFVADVLDRRATLASAEERLEQLQNRAASRTIGVNANNLVQGSPFLEGRTVTVAGAGLLERVLKAITKAGGRTVSSQVDIQGTPSPSAPGSVSVIVSCDIDEPGLQKLLFDLEAGMPYLFISQLEIQSSHISSISSGSQNSSVRVLLTVSGQWLGQP